MRPLFTVTMAFLLMFSANLWADNGEDPRLQSSLTLCSGETMTWEEYLKLRAERAAEYDLEIESAPFIPHTVSVWNNT